MSDNGHDPKGRFLSFLMNCRPSKAVSDDPRRPALRHPHVIERGGHKYLLATDSYIAAFLPLREDAPVGAIHVDALRRIDSGERGHWIEDDGTVVFGDDRTGQTRYARPVDSAFRNGAPTITFDPGTDQVVSIAINPWLLWRLAKALGATKRGSLGGVRLDVAVKDGTTAKAMKVQPLRSRMDQDDSEWGLIMPIKCENRHPLARTAERAVRKAKPKARKRKAKASA